MEKPSEYDYILCCCQNFLLDQNLKAFYDKNKLKCFLDLENILELIRIINQYVQNLTKEPDIVEIMGLILLLSKSIYKTRFIAYGMTFYSRTDFTMEDDIKKHFHILFKHAERYVKEALESDFDFAEYPVERPVDVAGNLVCLRPNDIEIHFEELEESKTKLLKATTTLNRSLVNLLKHHNLKPQTKA